METEELKPCPFCGDADLKEEDFFDPREFIIACESCRMAKATDVTYEEVVKKWNTRTPDTKEPMPRDRGMDINKADEIVALYEELEDYSCSCHISAPCYKCEAQPSFNEYTEALLILNTLDKEA